jgi:membrane dipeptidase
MEIYDSHGDIFYNLWQRHLEGERDVFAKYHLNDLVKGEVKGGIWVVYSDADFDLIEAYRIALLEYEPYKHQFDVIYGLEGLRNVPDLETFEKLYRMGIRHAMLTWNEANHLATGVAGEADRGLTVLGRSFLKFMEQHHMIVDLSHLNMKSFYDVLNVTKERIIASHSNAWALAPHRRNLSDEQIKAIAEVGGLIGVVAARNFVSADKTKQNISGFVDHIDHISNMVGTDHVMLGLDFMNYLDDFNNSNLDDLPDASCLQKLVGELRKRGYRENDVEKICYGNFKKLKEKVK